MTNLTNADIAAMKSRANAAKELRAILDDPYSAGPYTRDEYLLAAAKSSRDVPALLSEVAALRQQLDLADKAPHAWDCVGWQHDHMGDHYYDRLGCNCWKVEYDAAKEAIDHE